MAAKYDADVLHARVADVLGWTVEEAKRTGLRALRDLVRPVSRKLAWEITCALREMGARV